MQWKKQFWRYATVALGAFISGVGINTFLIPHQLFSGGVSGVAMILYFLFSWPIGIQIILLNIPIFYAAYRLLDRDYVICGIFGMVIFSLATDATRFLADLNFIDDTLLAAIYGGVISGIGAGMIFRVGGSAGGTDTIATIIKKYYSLNVGFVGFSINVFLMIVAAALFGVKPAMYTLLSFFVSSQVTDAVIEGLNRKKTIMIISDKNEEIADAILDEVGRGATFLEGTGAYTGQDKKVLFVVVTLTQISKIKFIAEKTDPHAFMIVQDAAEVLGHGFSSKKLR
ncbi:MAG: YitT family protein [Negativicutes bacterium]|nr:YitT family protein [Negativicutes bacterium]